MNTRHRHTPGQLAIWIILASAVAALTACEAPSYNKHMNRDAGTSRTHEQWRLKQDQEVSTKVPGTTPEECGEMNMQGSPEAPRAGSLTNSDPNTATSSSDLTEMLEYSLDNELVLSTEATEQAERQMLRRIVDDLHAGHSVCISPTDNQTRNANERPATGDTLVFTTADIESVIPWTRRMVRRGYTVIIDYDADSGLYRCTAYRGKKKKHNK